MPPLNEGKPDMLKRDAIAFQAHADLFDGIAVRAENLRWLNREVHGQIMTTAGIVCDRPRGDEKASASRFYFGRAINITRSEERGETQDSPEHPGVPRKLIEDMLALRLSVGDMVTNPPDVGSVHVAYETYQQLVRDLEKHCGEHNLPSLLPNLYLASSLHGRLRNDEAYLQKTPPVLAAYEKLMVLCSSQPKHLHAVATAMAQNNWDAESVAGIETAAEMSGCTVEDMCRKNPMLAETYVIALHKSGKHERVVEIGDAFPDFRDRPAYAEKYIRSLAALERHDRIAEVLATLGSTFQVSNSTLKTFVINICVESGWILYGNSGYQKIVDMIEGVIHFEINRGGHTDVIALYRQAIEELGDQTRIDALKKRLGE
jgi:hypothetical protein